MYDLNSDVNDLFLLSYIYFCFCKFSLFKILFLSELNLNDIAGLPE